jgi:hypothetical protein
VTSLLLHGRAREARPPLFLLRDEGRELCP